MDQLAEPWGLTRDRSTFSRRDVIQAICERLPAGTAVDAMALEQVANAFPPLDRVVPMLAPAGDEAEPRERYQRRDGRMMPIGHGDVLYSTPELLAAEQRLVDHAVRAHDSRWDRQR